jgi:hypothetical protein
MRSVNPHDIPVHGVLVPRDFHPASLATAWTRDRGRLGLIATIRQEW